MHRSSRPQPRFFFIYLPPISLRFGETAPKRGLTLEGIEDFPCVSSLSFHSLGSLSNLSPRTSAKVYFLPHLLLIKIFQTSLAASYPFE